MFWNQLKTVFLLATLSGLMLLFGQLVGGTIGLTYAFIMALLMNFISYFYADKIVRYMYGAQPLDPVRYAYIYTIVQDLCQTAHLPMPKLFYVSSNMANAFATGRNPSHASVTVTQGILDLLEEHELRGVLAHELSHIKNYDILVGTIAATIATMIAYLANIVRWNIFLGGHRNDREQSGSRLQAFIVAIIMPFAAMLIQLAISRTREYLADESGAELSNSPLALASALEKLTTCAQKQHLHPETPAHTSTASLFIVYPFSSSGWIHLFSTHPPLEKRIQRLRAMAR